VFRNTHVFCFSLSRLRKKKILDVSLKAIQFFSKCNFKFTPLYTLSGQSFLKNSTQRPFFQEKKHFTVINYVVFVIILPSMRINI